MIHYFNPVKAACTKALKSDKATPEFYRVSCPECLEYLDKVGIIKRTREDGIIFDFFAAVDSETMADDFYRSYREEYAKGVRTVEEMRVIKLQYMDFIKGRR